MKNVELIHSKTGAWRVPIQGMPPLTGWGVQYVSGMDDPEIKDGHWLAQWQVNSTRDSAVFTFEPGLHMSFPDEPDAIAISNALRKFADIDTRVVKI